MWFATRLALLLLPACASAATADEFKPAADMFAVSVRDTAAAASLKGELNRFLEAHHIPEFKTIKARDRLVLMFKALPATDVGKLTGEFKRWAAIQEDIRELPVLVHGQAYAIPTGMIMIQFKEGTPLEHARATLKEFDLTVVQPPTALRPTHFVVQGSDGAVIDPLTVARRIKGDSSVLFAEADLIVVGPKSGANLH
jgi:hypothetical protein